MPDIGIEDLVGLMQVELLAAEGERPAALGEADPRHPQHPLIEIEGGGDVADRQHEMVEAIDVHGARARRAAQASAAAFLSISTAASTRPRTAAQLLSNSAFSDALIWISITFSTPPPPSTTG